jgi:hypothetical protein
LLAACAQEDAVDFGFTIENVSISHSHQTLNVGLQQNLELSQQALEALEHGVTLTIGLEIELRNDSNKTLTQQDTMHFQIRYLPLIERYQLSEEASGELQTFSRLRHLLATMDNLNVRLPTGPLSPGNYELRTRIRLDKSRLPAPMQLPAWFSSRWQHDSEWSVWPFKISA